MNINRKYIIIFGALMLLLIIFTGAIVYYNERTNLAGSSNQIDHFFAPISGDQKYEIWCYENEDRAWNDCTEKTIFMPNQLISMSVNLEKLDNIITNDSYFLCYYSDLSNLGRECLSRQISTLENLFLVEKFVPEDKENFTLIKISIYPNDSFEDSEGITIIDLTGQLIQ